MASIRKRKKFEKKLARRMVAIATNKNFIEGNKQINKMLSIMDALICSPNIKVSFYDVTLDKIVDAFAKTPEEKEEIMRKLKLEC